MTVVYITKEDFIGGKRGHYDRRITADGQQIFTFLNNGQHENYFNLEYPTDDAKTNELLEDLGNIPKQLIQRISQESNSDILNKWLRFAAKASSLAEFEAKM